MTFRSLISFSLAAEFTAVALASVTAPWSSPNSHDSGARKSKDYSGVVVWLRAPRRARPAAPPRHGRMVQKDKKFNPHVLAVPVGTQVDFPELRPDLSQRLFELQRPAIRRGAVPAGTSRSLRFKRDGVVRVFCNIHQTMSAIIVVRASPVVRRYQCAGQVSRSRDVLRANIELRIFHERSLADDLNSLERKSPCRKKASTLPPISISETGYLPAPHKNKYGADYPPAPTTSAIRESKK